MVYTIEDIERYCQRFYGNARLLVTPFGYTVTFPTLPSGAATIHPEAFQLINISANGDFIAMGLSFTEMVEPVTVGSLSVPLCTIQLEDTGSNEKFTNDPMMLSDYANDGTAEIEFDYPRFLSGKSKIKVTMANISGDTAGATYTNVDVFLHGCLVRVFGQ